MFGKKSNAKKEMVIDSYLDENCSFSGDMRFQSGLRVDGQMNGNLFGLKTDSALVVEKKAVINGKVEAQNVIIDGTVCGPVVAFDTVIIRANGKVKGNVSYTRIQMEDGAIVDGQLIPLQLDEGDGEGQSLSAA